jgi:KUP system potassium uptake protein
MSSQPMKAGTAALSLAALGVVYGDIGTSPLYALKEVFGNAHHPVPITPDNVLGILSLIFWSLIVVVSIKYVAFVMRADNKGEGGIMALMALVLRGAEGKRYAPWLMLLGLFGAALFYGDGVITPAISVLSAVEGLEIATPLLKPYVIPATILVLAVLFACQYKGTAKVGALFGPVMILWFSTLGLLGIVNIVQQPHVLTALNPLYAVSFMAANTTLGFLALGAVFLALTGAETLYADMGHFGRKPVQLAWFGLVLPALTLNYFGQGALILHDPATIKNPFYLLAPEWALYPMVALATAATVIASQAVISGVYSITQQAIQLGYCPRMEVRHTSGDAQGQVYMPGINWLLFLAVVGLVLGFGSSTSIAAAYGIAVSMTMIITTILAFIVVRSLWRWHWLASALVLGVFLVVDLAFFSANIVKIHDGGWFPLTFGFGILLLMTTWKRGRSLLHSRLLADAMPLEDFVRNISGSSVQTIPGTAVFMTQNLSAVPHALTHSLKHYKALHEKIVLLTVAAVDEPTVPDGRRLEVARIDDRFYTITVRYGFMDQPDLPHALALCDASVLAFDMMDTSFFLGRETLIPRLGSEMALWREKLFVAMFRNAGSAAAYFKLPPNRVVELGAQVVM